jgi:PAS domain S-box-containing protein
MSGAEPIREVPGALPTPSRRFSCIATLYAFPMAASSRYILAFLSDSATAPPQMPVRARYGLALLATVAAFGPQWLLGRWMASPTYFLFLAAIILAAWKGGYGPGVLATASSVVFIFLSLHPAASNSLAPALLSTALFVGVATVMTWMCARVRSTLREAQATRASEQANSQVFAVTLRSIGDAVLTTDAEGRVRFINPMASYFTGWREAEATGQPLSRVLRLFHPTTREPLPPVLSEVDTERPVHLGQQALLRSRTGGELPIEHTRAPIRDAEGRRLGFVFIFRDISSRQREDRERAQLLARELEAHQEAESQRQRLETLFMQAPVAICLTRGPEHVIELINPLARTLGGERFVVGRAVRQIMPELEPTMFQLLDEVYRKGTPFTGHEVPIRADFSGTNRPEVKYFDLTWQPWRGADGLIQGTMGLCAEVTEQVLARREVEALAADLQRALQIRDDFLSVASHELKTPLTSLQLQLQLLWRSLPEKDEQGDPHPARQRIEATRRPAERLHQLVNNLLDVSRIRAGRLALERETVDFAALLKDVVTRNEADAAGAGCQLVLQAEAPVVGRWDRLRLEQVVTNLLSNALKYGAAHPVELSVVQEGSSARLVVRDHGIGIASESQARIFQRFERAVSERHYGGFGLGLWIVKQIVDSLGGDIRVESQVGQGATFIVTLPVEPPPGSPLSGLYPTV